MEIGSCDPKLFLKQIADKFAGSVSTNKRYRDQMNTSSQYN